MKALPGAEVNEREARPEGRRVECHLEEVERGDE